MSKDAILKWLLADFALTKNTLYKSLFSTQNHTTEVLEEVQSKEIDAPWRRHTSKVCRYVLHMDKT